LVLQYEEMRANQQYQQQQQEEEEQQTIDKCATKQQ